MIERMFESLTATLPRSRSMYDPRPALTALSAHDVAAILRDRLPGLPVTTLHLLLYYCQGHHLAAFDEPLFSERISAWDTGPVVAAFWRAEHRGEVPAIRRRLDDDQLDTVSYVVRRYGALTGPELEHRTRGETPWRLADSGRGPGQSARVKPEWMRQYFRSCP